MSASEILAELPKLTAEERAIIRKRLDELEREDSALFLHESADEMFRVMDSEEARDRGKAR